MKKINVKKLTITSLSIALVCVGTIVIQIPIPFGYMHFGNVLILLIAYLFPGDIALISSGVGSALADLITGYPIWILPTLIIKGLMGFASSYICHKHHKKNKVLSISVFFGSLSAVFIMVLGYYLAGVLLFDGFIASATQIPGLSIEGLLGMIGFYIIGFALEKINIFKYLDISQD